jgi:hypothetical protein
VLRHRRAGGEALDDARLAAAPAAAAAAVAESAAAATGDGRARACGEHARAADTCARAVAAAVSPVPPVLIACTVAQGLPLPHAFARAHGAAASTPRAAEAPLAFEPPESRPPAQLSPPPAAWLVAQGGLSSERPARPSPASVRAASGAAPVNFTAPLVVSAPAHTLVAPAPSPAARAAILLWVGTTAAAGAQALGTLPTSTQPPLCLRHGGSSSPGPCPRCRCSRRCPRRRQAHRRWARDWTDGPRG